MVDESGHKCRHYVFIAWSANNYEVQSKYSTNSYFVITYILHLLWASAVLVGQN